MARESTGKVAVVTGTAHGIGAAIADALCDDGAVVHSVDKERVDLTDASAKAAQIGFTRQMAHELGPYGITVNCIAPGFILSNPTTQRQWESYGAEGQRQLVLGIAMRRLGVPSDIANGVRFFAANESSWVTGQTIAIDGGSALL